MADRLYTIEHGTEKKYVIYDFEAREVKRTDTPPHPEGRTEQAPFYADSETFWMVVQSHQELDEKNQQYAKRDRF